MNSFTANVFASEGKNSNLMVGLRNKTMLRSEVPFINWTPVQSVTVRYVQVIKMFLELGVLYI